MDDWKASVMTLQGANSQQPATILSASALSVAYGAVQALTDADLEVRTGEIVALIGPNGAGKSTALRAIAGILPHYDGRITGGDIRFDGQRINGLPPHRLIRFGLSLVPENRHVFPTMTVAENLEMGGYTLGRGQAGSAGRGLMQERLEYVYDTFPRLAERRRQRAGTLSTGEQQMLAMGRGLMVRPKMLLVDEPTVGLSPNYVDLVFDKLGEINKQGTSILLVEQNARMALEACHRAYVFSVGRIALDGRGSDLVENPDVRRVYFGSATGSRPDKPADTG